MFYGFQMKSIYTVLQLTKTDENYKCGRTWHGRAGYLDPLRLSKTREISLNMANLQKQQSIVFLTSSVGLTSPVVTPGAT